MFSGDETHPDDITSGTAPPLRHTGSGPNPRNPNAAGDPGPNGRKRDETQGFAFQRLHAKLQTILKRHDLTIEKALLDGFYEQAGDIEQAIKDPMAALAYWLSFEQVVLEYKWSLLPPPEERKTNNWAGDVYGRIKIIARFKRTYPPKTPDVHKRVLAVLGIKGEAQLPLCECKTLADATARIEKDAAEVRSIMPTKKDETSQPPLMDDSKPKINLVALGVKIGEVFAKYDLPYNGASYKAATGDIGAPGSIDNGKSESTILSQVEGWCMEQQQAKKTAEKPALGDEIDLDLSEGARKLQALMDAEKKTVDAEKIDEKATPLNEAANPDADDQPEATEAVPGSAKVGEPETIEAEVILEDQSEIVDGYEYIYSAKYVPSEKAWSVAMSTYVNLTTAQKEDIEVRTTAVLHLTQDAPVGFGWILRELSAELIDGLRNECYKAIENAYGKDYEGKDGEPGRIRVLKEIWKDTPEQGTRGAWRHFGREGALFLVREHCFAKRDADLKAMKDRHAQENQQFDERKALALTSGNNITPISSAPSYQPSTWLRIPNEHELKFIEKLAATYYESGMYTNLKNKAQFFAVLYKAFELQIGLGAALDNIHIIGGKPALGANLMLALANTSGAIRDIRIVGDDRRCEVTMWRKDRETAYIVSFSIEDAEKAGLPKNNPTWGKYPKAMLKARAVSACFRAAIPEIGMGIKGVADDDDDEDNLIVLETRKITDAGDLPQAAGF